MNFIMTHLKHAAFLRKRAGKQSLASKPVIPFIVRMNIFRKCAMEIVDALIPKSTSR